MKTYKIEEKLITFKFDYNPKIIEAIKKIEGRTYMPNIKAWMIPISLQNNHSIVNIINDFSFGEDNNVVEIKTDIPLIDFSSKIKELALALQPRKYQNFAIDYMLTQKRVINGDDMGLGKTLEAIFSCEIKGLFPVVVVTLSSVKYHWEKLWAKTNSRRIISVLDSSNKVNNFDAEVLIVNYDMLGKKIKHEDDKSKDKFLPKYNELFELNPKCVVFDEMHVLKSHKSIRSKLAKQLVKDVEYVFGLTGTMVMNRPVELISLLNIIGTFDSLFGNWKSFVYRYCKATQTRFGLDTSGASNLIELNKVLRANCYLRREKREVLTSLPEVQTTVLDFKISNLKEYKSVETDLIQYLQVNYSVMKAQSALIAEFLVLRNVLRQLSGKGKVKEVIEWLENFIEESEEKIIVFGIYRATLKELSTHFKCKVIDGDIQSIKKQQMVDDFKTNKDRILFGNMNALGVGTDGLQDSCSNIFILELPDRSGDLDQVISRVDRSGQLFRVNVWFGLSPETIDVDIWDMIESKRKATEAVNKGFEIKARSFDDMLIKKYLKR